MGRSASSSTAPATADRRYMERCLALAVQAEGRTSPNPLVGAVVAKAGRILGEALHRRAGGAHAEVLALRQAGPAARGATLYVNLEPCAHQGRTPPCVDAIIAAGVRRVVASHRDPFHLVRGRGFRAMRRAGIEVITGVLRAQALRVNRTYLRYARESRPFVLVKAAMTLDGRIATARGRSRWISSRPSRRHAHGLRAQHDAVMVGVGTVMSDDPRLTARRARAGARASTRSPQPVRVILDSRLRTRPSARMLRDRTGGPVMIYCTPRAPRGKARLLESRGARVIVVGNRGSRRVSLRAVLTDLARRGVTSVIIEGGAELIWSALAADLVDRVTFYIAPMLMGGRRSVPVVGGAGVSTLRKAFALSGMMVKRSGPDLLVEGYVGKRRG